MKIEIINKFEENDICICKMCFWSKNKIINESEIIFCELRLNYFEKDLQRITIKHKTTDKITVEMTKKVGSKAIKN